MSFDVSPDRERTIQSFGGGSSHGFPVGLKAVQMPCVVELNKTHDLVEEYYFLHDLGAGCGGLRTSSLGDRHHGPTTIEPNWLSHLKLKCYNLRFWLTPSWDLRLAAASASNIINDLIR